MMRLNGDQQPFAEKPRLLTGECQRLTRLAHSGQLALIVKQLGAVSRTQALRGQGTQRGQRSHGAEQASLAALGPLNPHHSGA